MLALFMCATLSKGQAMSHYLAAVGGLAMIWFDSERSTVEKGTCVEFFFPLWMEMDRKLRVGMLGNICNFIWPEQSEERVSFLPSWTFTALYWSVKNTSQGIHYQHYAKKSHATNSHQGKPQPLPLERAVRFVYVTFFFNLGTGSHACLGTESQ